MAASDTTSVLISSRTADIVSLSDLEILKLFHAGADDEAEREAEIAQIVQATGVRCPRVLGRSERDGRAGILYSRAPGASLARWLGLRRPWRIRAAGRTLAEAHADLHTYHAPAAPSLRERLRREIQAAAVVPARTRAFALHAVAMMPDSDTLCHGDLTTDNIMLTPDGPLVIDWSEASHGDPAADVARSVIHMAVAHKYYLSAARRPLAQCAHWRLSAAYTRHYQWLRPETAARVQYWLLPVAVARLGRDAPISQRFLLRLIARLAERAPAL
jgi:aminoglycoside phosphotransferase (APT) family kinase protein